MNISAYNTYVGKAYGYTENITNTIKRLALMNDLPRVDNGVYLITHQSGDQLPFFGFPLSTFGMDRKPITVIDDRPFRNKSDVITNTSERMAFLVCGFVQQDIMKKDFSVLHSTRMLAAKVFTRAFGGRIIQRASLDADEAWIVNAALTHYYVCMTEERTNDIQFISQNVIRQTMGVSGVEVNNLLDEMGTFDGLKALFEFLTNRPGMYKLKSTSFIDFIALGQTIWFSSIGKQITGAALEFPPLIIGIIAACIANKSAYGKTGIGIQLDPKYNERDLNAFRGVISNSYPVKF